MIRKIVLLVVFFISSCVYTLDIQQGNILGQSEIDKLRPGLTKNQVVFVLGNPVVDDSFADDKWIYMYSYTSRNNHTDKKSKLELYFEDNKLVNADGDFTIPEELKRDKN